MEDVSGPIVIFDGMCHLCSGAIEFVLAHEREPVLRFATLQSNAGRRLLSRFGISAEGAGTFYLIDRERVHVRSDAAVRLARHLRWPWRAAAAVRFFPRGLRDAVYDFLARRRYRWFGERDRCFAPSGNLFARFLNEER